MIKKHNIHKNQKLRTQIRDPTPAAMAVPGPWSYAKLPTSLDQNSLPRKKEVNAWMVQEEWCVISPILKTTLANAEAIFRGS